LDRSAILSSRELVHDETTVATALRGGTSGLLRGAPASARVRTDKLSLREREVLQLIADGFGNRAIAGALYLSEETVKTHVQRVLRKLRATSRANAAAIGIRIGLIR
jgi:DNA-binding NarL/FixJ family response regulator